MPFGAVTYVNLLRNISFHIWMNVIVITIYPIHISIAKL